MKLIAPDYYKSFKCISEKCKHTCCKGWEIDIDDNTASFYKKIEGPLGKRLKEGMEKDEFGVYHFILDEDENCPFLNKKGLCDIYSTLGEDCLCQICYDHPRFRDFYEDRTEIGLGLSCEAVCKLVVEKKDKARLVVLDDDGKNEAASEKTKKVYELRDKAFSCVQNREKSISERTADMLRLIGEEHKKRTPKEEYFLYSSLEKLEKNRDEIYKGLISLNEKERDLVLSENETAFEQLLFYFVFRYMAEAVDDGKYKERLSFCADSVYFIASLSALKKQEKGKLDIEDIEECARFFSSEVEYSDINMETFI